MALQSLPPSAEAYAASNTREIGAAVAAVERVWSRMDPADFDGSYAALEPTLLAVLDTAQERVSTAATAYVPRVMADLEMPLPSPAYRLRPGALVGVTGDGLTTEGLAHRAVIGAKRAVAGGLEPAAALAQSGQFLTTATGTLLSDTGRSAERVAGGARGVDVWVRMLVPPSCGRCVILAGRISGRSEAFRRHPRCDCRNVPATEEIAGDLTTNPFDYLDSLDDDQLARALGSRANAQAFRAGADQNQIINAYRSGVRSAQVYGRNVRYTTEGTTRRGFAYTRMQSSGLRGEAARRGETVTRITRTGAEARTVTRNVARQPRLMPESIFQIATDPADAQRLLRQYGWIVDDAPRVVARRAAAERVASARLDPAVRAVQAQARASEILADLRKELAAAQAKVDGQRWYIDDILGGLPADNPTKAANLARLSELQDEADFLADHLRDEIAYWTPGEDAPRVVRMVSAQPGTPDSVVTDHLRDLVQIPDEWVDRFVEQNVSVKLFQGSVVQHSDLTYLRYGASPRGWSPGSSWESVAGVAVRETAYAGTGAHGSSSLVLHELGHAVDHAFGALSTDARFLRAYREVAWDQPYFAQPGDAGPSEAWAEAFAELVKPGTAREGGLASPAGQNLLAVMREMIDGLS